MTRPLVVALALVSLAPFAPPASAQDCSAYLRVTSMFPDGFGVNPDAGSCDGEPWNHVAARDVLPGTHAIRITLTLASPASNATALPLGLHGLGFDSDAYSLDPVGFGNDTTFYESNVLAIPGGPLATGSLKVSTTLQDGTRVEVTYQKPA